MEGWSLFIRREPATTREPKAMKIWEIILLKYYGGEKCWMEYTENPRKPFFLLVLGEVEV
jgi:hypothetical protein